MEILDCHHPEKRRRRVIAVEGDFPDVFDLSGGDVFAIALRRGPDGEDFQSLEGFAESRL